MRMDFKEIAEVISERKGAVAAAALGIAALGGLAWALSTGPLTPVGDGAGSTGSMGSHSPAAMGSAKADDGVMHEPDEAPESTEGEEPATGDPTETEPQSPAAGSGEGAGDSGKQQASSQATSKPSQGGSEPSAPKPSPKPDAPKPSKPKPSHKHSWNAVYRTEPVYGQQWVSKWEDVFIKRQERYRCTTCGATYYSLGEMNAHLDSTIDWDSMTGHAGYLDDSYDVWEKRDNGSYQTVQTGTKQVLDHYECSCGATK